MALKKIIINQQCVFTTLSSILRIVHFRVELSYPCLWYKATKGGNQSDETAKGPVSQQVWHDKDPSLLKGHVRRALQVFASNSDVAILIQYFGTGR